MQWSQRLSLLLRSLLVYPQSTFEIMQDEKNCETPAPTTTTSRPRTVCDHHNCEYSCVEQHAGALCACEAGYALNDDGRSCHDVDECAGGMHGYVQSGSAITHTPAALKFTPLYVSFVIAERTNFEESVEF